MRNRGTVGWVGLCLAGLAAACGGDSGSRGSAGDSESGIPAGSGTDDGETADSDSDSGTDSGSGDSQGASGDTADSSGDDSGSGTKFDLGGMPDTGEAGCGSSGGGGMGQFSYIWIANSPEGTVSKINTETGVEEGRYRTGPMASPDPSRTSVNLYGDAVAVNRNGGIAKVATRIEDCVDMNGDNVITTSTGPADVKAWGEDECVLWHTALSASGSSGPRPVAWEGLVDEQGCPDPNPRVWVGHYTGGGTNTGEFYRLDGATGAILDQVSVPNWSGENWGPYGGATDAAGNFWVTGWNDAPAIRIDAVNLTVDRYDYASGHWFYGMALDQDGDPWVGGCDGNVYHLNVANGQWVNVGAAGGCLRGLQVDQEGMAWIAGNSPCRLVQVDTTTETIVNANVPLAGCQTPVGVSIDSGGYVWVVDQGGFAYKVDPNTYAVQLQVTGLSSPYTYSDMTGAGLNLVVNPPG